MLFNDAKNCMCKLVNEQIENQWKCPCHHVVLQAMIILFTLSERWILKWKLVSSWIAPMIDYNINRLCIETVRRLSKNFAYDLAASVLCVCARASGMRLHRHRYPMRCYLDAPYHHQPSSIAIYGDCGAPLPLMWPINCAPARVCFAFTVFTSTISWDHDALTGVRSSSNSSISMNDDER